MFTKRETNICKGAAILMMLFHHLFNDYGEYAGHPVNYWPLTGDQTTLLACLCGGCVTIFVFLSGYGLAHSYDARFQDREPEGKELTEFIGIRCWRLLERYWFVFLLALLASPLGRTPAQAYGASLKPAAVYFAIDFCGLSFMFGTPTLNPTWWYMSVALYIIIFMPFLMMAAKRWGALPVAAGIMALVGLLSLQSEASHYIFGLLLGILCYHYDVFRRLRDYCEGGRARLWAVSLLLLLFLCLIVRFRLDFRYFGIVDGLFAMGFTWLCGLLVARIPLANRCLELLGRHSANMFLTHNLLYSFYFLDFYYSFRHPLTILAALALTSLALSAVMELVKKITGYERRMDALYPGHILPINK